MSYESWNSIVDVHLVGGTKDTVFEAVGDRTRTVHINTLPFAVVSLADRTDAIQKLINGFVRHKRGHCDVMLSVRK